MSAKRVRRVCADAGMPCAAEQCAKQLWGMKLSGMQPARDPWCQLFWKEMTLFQSYSRSQAAVSIASVSHRC